MDPNTKTEATNTSQSESRYNLRKRQTEEEQNNILRQNMRSLEAENSFHGSNGHERVDRGYGNRPLSKPVSTDSKHEHETTNPPVKPTKSIKSSSKGSMASQSSRQLKLKAEILAHEELSLLELEALDIKRKLVEKKLVLQKQIIDEEESSESADDLEENEISHQSTNNENHPNCYHGDKVKDWLSCCEPEGPKPDPLQVIAESFKKVLEGAAAHSNPDDGEMKRFIARQASQRDLSSFSGKSEEWPLFISRFQNSTDLCGYTQEEEEDYKKHSLGKLKNLYLHYLPCLLMWIEW